MFMPVSTGNNIDGNNEPQTSSILRVPPVLRIFIISFIYTLIYYSNAIFFTAAYFLLTQTANNTLKANRDAVI